MTIATAERPGRIAARRVALFLAVVMSGGLLLFPRLPMLIVILLICTVLSGRITHVRRELVPVFALLAVVVVVTFVRLTPVDVATTATRFANFIAACALLGVYLRSPPGSLCGDLHVFLPAMAVQAVLTPLLALAAPWMFISIDIKETTYQTAFLVFTYHVFIEDSSALPRPDGLFFEPGVFQIYLNLYLYLSLFVTRQLKHAWLAALAVITTQSTTGLLVLALILSIAVIRRLADVPLRRKLPLAAAVLVLAVPLTQLVVTNVQEKTTGEFRGSSWAREYDLITGLGVIAANPILGIGFDYNDYYREAGKYGFADTQLSDYHIEERGNSNGIVNLLYSLGIPLGLVFILGLFRQTFFPHRLLFGACMLLCLFGEALSLSPFFLLLVFSGLAAKPRAPRDAAARTPPRRAMS